MSIEQIPLELIDENPFNPRKHYPQGKVNEMANSLREVGLRQVPEGRRIDGKVQIAYGHMRLRAFLSLQKKDPGKWKAMPVDIKEIADQDMFHYAWEENIRRTEITPIELARCVQSFSEMFPDVQEKDIGAKHDMSEANVSNMKRVLRLPEKFLEKIDKGTISFTQGRELLTLEGLPDSESLMSEAFNSLKIGNKSYGEPNTVDGLQKSIYRAIKDHFPPLEKEFAGYRYDLVFDTRLAGCLDCEKMIRSHPTKSGVAHFCSDEMCWQAKQTEHREKAAAAAKAKMEAEVIQRAAQSITREEKAVKVAPKPGPVMIDENTILVNQETFLKLEASNSCGPISEGQAVRKPVEIEGKLYLATMSGAGKVEAYVLVPREEYKDEVRTYSVPKGREYKEYYKSLRDDPKGFYHGILVKRGKGWCVLVGPEVTFVTEVEKEDFSQEKLAGEVEAAGETVKKPPFYKEGYLHVSVAGEKLKIPSDKVAIPQGVLEKAKEAAGTRAEVLDLNDIRYGDFYDRQVKQGYATLSDELRHVDEPDECLTRCTHGFHYAFDSKAKEQKEIYICSDTKCLAKKKGAATRKRNAAGQAQRNAEKKAIGQVLDQVGKVTLLVGDHLPGIMAVGNLKTEAVAVTRPFLYLIIYNQLHGANMSKFYYGEGTKTPENWLWDKLSAGTPKEKRDEPALWKLIQKLSDAELAKLVAEMMFYYLQDWGDIAKYEVKTTKPLAFFGITLNDAVAS